MTYKFLEHTADIKIQVENTSLEKAFCDSAFSLRELVLDSEKIKIKPEKCRIIGVEGKDLSGLLYNFLEEFIFLLDAEDFILSAIEDINIVEEKNGKNKNYNLSAKILGDDASRYKFTNKVKAITFNEMKIELKRKGKNKIFIQFVLDV